jgi:hypothetical protein
MNNILEFHVIPIGFSTMVMICMRRGRVWRGGKMRGRIQTLCVVLYLLHLAPAPGAERQKEWPPPGNTGGAI